MPLQTDDIAKFTNKSCPLAPEGFEPSPDHLKTLQETKVLVIGAGGLGCEILKNLALSGFRDIHVIDMDTIDVSNLNRQFLFRRKDVGQPKATVAAAFIEKRCPGVKVTPYFGKIQDKDEEYYAKFKLVIAGLDSVEARRWINSMLVGMVELDDDGDIADPDTIIPLIDGGTEGFKGHARLILPRISSCFECSLELFPPQVLFQMCTIAHTPRLPEHCIAYASQVLWPQERANVKMDTDNADHMLWLYEKAKARAAEFGIEGVTLKKTQGVVKNIIPAIASTNAAIAAAEVNEALKFVTTVAPSLDNYMMYNGVTGLYTYTFEYQQRESCVVCGTASLKLSFSKDDKVSLLLDKLAENPLYQLKKPSLRTAKSTIYMQGALSKQLAPNLEKKISDFVGENDVISVTDPALNDIILEVLVRFEN